MSTTPPRPLGTALLLDRYFLTVPALKTLNALNRAGAVRLEIVIKAKNPVRLLKSLSREDLEGAAPAKKGPTPLECVEGEKPCRKVLEAVRSIEMHMTLSCIAMGILQSLSIRLIGKISSSQIRYQRMHSKGRVSEAALMHYFRKHFLRFLKQKPELCITQIIQELQAELEEPWDSLAS